MITTIVQYLWAVNQILRNTHFYWIISFPSLAIRESQRYFIPPVSTLLLFSFFVMAATFFGFQKFKSRGISLATSPISDVASPKDLKIYEEVKKEYVWS